MTTEIDRLTRTELDRRRRYNRCKVCGSKLDLLFDMKKHRPYLACHQDTSHTGFERIPSQYEEKGLESLNIPTRRKIMETTTELMKPEDMTLAGRKALKELIVLVKHREPLVINGKQYLYFTDYQMLGAFFGITAYVTKTEPQNIEKPDSTGTLTFLETNGYFARAVAMKDGKEISAAEAVCFKDEKNWQNKPLFQLLSMAQTRACAKALRNCLSWVVKLPLDSGAPKEPIADETVEEAQASFNNGGRL